MSALLKLHKFNLNFSELKDVPDEHVAAFSMSAHAINETNALSRIFLFCGQDDVRETEINAAAFIQRLTLLRVWSAKLFEYTEFVKFEGRGNRTSDKILLRLSKEAKDSFASLCENNDKEFMKRLRNQVTNHYRIDPARRNLQHLDPAADASMYLSESVRSNAFFLLGEDVAFGAAVARFSKENNTDIVEQIERWVDFNLAANVWANDFHASLFKETIRPFFPDRHTTEMSYWLPETMVQEFERGKMPLFMRPAR